MRRPGQRALAAARAAGASEEFSYAEVGATLPGEPSVPARYDVDSATFDLGRGEAVFEKAKAAVRGWSMFDIGWVSVTDWAAPISEGTVQCIVMHTLGLWSVNFSRIVYVVDDLRPATGEARYGFAYGTLPLHLETGEEQFLVTFDAASEHVRYRITAFSRPRHLLARLAYPIARSMQARFVRDSGRAMARAVASPGRSNI